LRATAWRSIVLFVAWGPHHVRPHLRPRVRDVLGAVVVGLAMSGNVAATTCVTHTEVCQTLVIQASGPLTVYVQALSCIAASGISWDARVTNGSRVVHVPVDDSPSVVPGRTVKLPTAGRWWLVVRMSNTDPNGRCVQGESSTDPVAVRGVSATPQPTPRPTPRPRPEPASQTASGPPSSQPSGLTGASPSTSGSPEPSASGEVAGGLSLGSPPDEGGDVLPDEGGDVFPGGTPESGQVNPLLVAALFALGVGGIELVAYAIRRELKSRRRSVRPDSGQQTPLA